MRALLAVFLIALAGCADAVEPTEDELSIDEDLTASETTGVIRGVVVDTAIVPIAGVTITGEGLETVSADDGSFGFGDLDPRLHCLEFTKVGYESAKTCNTVEAGIEKPPIVRVMMTPDPSSIPYVDAYTFTGMVKCGASYIAACGAADIVGLDVGDRFMYEQELAAVPTHVTMEAVWKGTQPTGDNFQLRLGHSPAGPATVDHEVAGPSPVQTWMNETVIQDVGLGPGNNLVGRMFVWEMEGTNIQGHTGQCVPIVIREWCHGPGVAIDQKFDLYTHVFHGYAPPADWRFTDDEPPAPPS